MDKTIHGNVWQGDNLSIMRKLPSNFVPFVYLDPPFMSDRVYTKEGHKFSDKWGKDQFNKLDLLKLTECEEKGIPPDKSFDISKGGVSRGLICYLQYCVPNMHSWAMASYLLAMSLRLKELKRILTANGSIYLHCDASASHYLKICMDSIFGKEWFRDEVVWKRLRSGHYIVKNSWGRTTDTILFYAGPNNTFYPVRIPYPDGWLDKEFNRKDEVGYYGLQQLLKSHMGDIKEEGKNESTTAWRGYNPVDKRFRGWFVPKDSDYAQWLEKNHIPDYTKMGVHARLDALDAANMIVHYPYHPYYKRYLAGHGNKGLRLNNLILDTFVGSDPVYPTQKPLNLLEYLIQASTNAGDLVFDPFCGSGTALVAANKLGRQWAGIDRNDVCETIQARIDKSSGLFSQPIKINKIVSLASC